MRTIVIPDDVKVLDDRTKQPETWTNPETGEKSEWFPFWFVARNRWLNDQAGAPNMSELRRWLKLVEAIETSSPGDRVDVEDSEFEKLKKIVEADVGKVPPLSARQILPFFEAVLGAEEKK